MGIEVLLFAVVLLIGFAVFDLMVGVSNDAVNFLNSSFGSHVAPRYVVMIVASIGIIVGVSFSSGMMEVARKGIFHPQFFTMPELLVIFLAVMITDIILLDMFNTYGLPTSTTVSIVFELLGGAVAVSILKILQSQGGLDSLGDYINTGKALMIVLGILLSIGVAFSLGAVAQFLTRLLFTFEYKKRLKRFGALWGGMAFAFITYFILVKGAKGAVFISAESAAAIRENAFYILLIIFAASAVVLQVLLYLKVNILKLIVLVGTFALAMAFAANDLMNFIGVPVAGYQAYTLASATDAPLTGLMGSMAEKVPTQPYMLLIAGGIMVVTLWFSKKVRTVSETELSLGRQSSGSEKYESVFLSRAIVGVVIRTWNLIQRVVPSGLQSWVQARLNTDHYPGESDTAQGPSFDLIRASVNMMVASVVISYATSQKLPLSTTYVTFMTAMGTSLADLAWGRDSAVYRVAGVFTVIGGWFMTALSAFTGAAVVATVIFYGQEWGLLAVLLVAGTVIWRNHRTHASRASMREMEAVFNLKKITDVNESISITFEHMAVLLREVRGSLSATLAGLYVQDEVALRRERRKTKIVQRWANTIIANVFKCMRLVLREDGRMYLKYPQTVRCLQKVADAHHDIVARAYSHVSNHHAGLLDVQRLELQKIGRILDEMLLMVETAFDARDAISYKEVRKKDRKLRALAEKLNQEQIERIRTGESKTRLSILFYAIVGDAMMLSSQNLKLIEIFAEAFGDLDTDVEFDMEGASRKPVG